MNPPPPLGHYIDLEARDGGVVRSFVAEPRTPPIAAVVVLQHKDLRHPEEQAARRAASAGMGHPGVNSHVRQMAEAFASEGFLAIAPSTFGRGRSGLDYGYRFETRLWRSGLAKPLEALGAPAVMLDIEAAVAHARRLLPHRQIGAVGYCWGALLAWRAACELEGLDAAVCHYPGGIDGDADRHRQVRCPTEVHLPGDGRWLSRRGIQAFIAAQSSALSGDATPPRLTVHQYEAAYGFMQPDDPAYDATAFRLAHNRTLTFLREHAMGASERRVS